MERREVADTVSGGTVAGHVVQARDIGAVHLHGVPPAETPRQIRVPRPTFVNRDRELAALTSALGRLDDGRPTVVACTGLGGVGKTELVSQFGFRNRATFVDGDLYADLATYRHLGGVDLSEVLAGFLRAFGVEAPASLPERAARFRTVTAKRQVLVFLDNVEHAAEVRTLLPACGLVVVAGRRRLPGLVLDGAEVLQLGPLSPAAGATLVRRRLGPQRGSERDLRALVELCGGLPLALNAVGFQLLEREDLEVGQAVAELSDPERRLVSLNNEEGGIDRVLDPVYRRLSPHALAFYHVVGANPGPFVSVELATAAGVDGVREALAELRAAHLLDDVAGGGPEKRYRAHDLVRLHARSRARALPEYTELLALIVGYYRGRTALADTLVLGDRFRIQEPDGRGMPGFAGKAEALQWLRAERADLRELVRVVAEQGWHGEVWRLCESLWALYHSDKNYGDWIETHRLGVEAAQWDNRPDAVIRMRNQLARAYYELKEYASAAEQVAMATELLPLVEEPRLSGVLYETDGLLCLAAGRPERAVERFGLAREANAGDDHGVVVQSYNIAQALVEARRAAEAVDVLEEATSLAERTADAPMLMRLPLVRARAHRALGEPQAATGWARVCVERASELGQRAKEREAHRLLLALAEETGDDDLAARSRARIAELD
ncbi:AAA family ATPase [Kitasatospora sp. NPDC018619]|uniref:AAA family ATPase n=1 Tax=unclassified Kitasatospora TaxID=2633591 RepID=UPI00379FCB88